MRLSCTLTEILGPKDKGDTSLTFWGHVTSWGHEFDFLRSRDVIGHVTIGHGICSFLLGVHFNNAPILHGYEDI